MFNDLLKMPRQDRKTKCDEAALQSAKKEADLTQAHEESLRLELLSLITEQRRDQLKREQAC